MHSTTDRCKALSLSTYALGHAAGYTRHCSAPKALPSCSRNIIRGGKQGGYCSL